MDREKKEEIERLEKKYAKTPHNIFRSEEDEWYFGALLVTGQLIPFSHIYEKEFMGEKWVDLETIDANDYNFHMGTVHKASCSRDRISIQLKHIVAIYELTDT